MFSFSRFLQSFTDASNGIRYVYKNEQNFRLQVAVAVVVLLLIGLFPLRVWEAIVLILLIIMVLTMELLNSALEHFSDIFKPRVHPEVRTVKDIMAGATLLTSLGAFIIGVLILYPHFISLVK